MGLISRQQKELPSIDINADIKGHALPDQTTQDDIYVIPFDPDIGNTAIIKNEAEEEVIAAKERKEHKEGKETQSLFPSESRMIPLSLIVEFPINKDIWGDKEGVAARDRKEHKEEGIAAKEHKEHKEGENSLASQITETGFCAPLLVIATDKRYMLLSGHRRKQALVEQGITEARCDIYSTPAIALYREWLIAPPKDLQADAINRQRKLAYQDIAALVLACNTSRFTSFHPALIKAASVCVKKYDMDPERVLKIVASTNQECADLLRRCLSALEGIDPGNYTRALKRIEDAINSDRLDEYLTKNAEKKTPQKTPGKSTGKTEGKSPSKADAQGPLRGSPEGKAASPTADSANVSKPDPSTEYSHLQRQQRLRSSIEKLLGSLARAFQEYSSLTQSETADESINKLYAILESNNE